jgi:hypothetical protein
MGRLSGATSAKQTSSGNLKNCKKLQCRPASLSSHLLPTHFTPRVTTHRTLACAATIVSPRYGPCKPCDMPRLQPCLCPRHGHTRAALCPYIYGFGTHQNRYILYQKAPVDFKKNSADRHPANAETPIPAIYRPFFSADGTMAHPLRVHHYRVFIHVSYASHFCSRFSTSISDTKVMTYVSPTLTYSITASFPVLSPNEDPVD